VPVKWDLLVYDWLHSVDKITIMYCCYFHRDAVYFRVFRYSEFISRIWEKPYYDKLQCHKLQEGYFRIPGRFCADSNSEKSNPLFRPDGQVKHPDAPQSATSVRTTWQYRLDSHQCREDSNCSSLHPSERLSNTFEHSL
jgi:hypothetical protein